MNQEQSLFQVLLQQIGIDNPDVLQSLKGIEIKRAFYN